MTRTGKLLVISGPIGAGKSTVASALHAAFRDSRRTAAVVDLDRVYMMFDDCPPMTDPRISRQAPRTAAGPHGSLRAGRDRARDRRRHLLDGVRTRRADQSAYHPGPACFSDAAGRRRGGAPARLGDTGRRASRNPVFLRASHADFDAVTPIATDAIIDSTSLTVDAVVAAIMAVLEHVSPPDTGGALFNDIDCVQSPFLTWMPESRSTATGWATA